MIVTFTKDDCSVIRKDDSIFINGSRSLDNYYIWNASSTFPSTACLVSREDATDLWHMRLGHLNPRGLAMIVSKEAVCGLHALKIKERRICG